MIELDADFPQVHWFMANALFFIAKIRENCTKDKVVSYLKSTRETLIMSKYCYDDLKLSTRKIRTFYVNTWHYFWRTTEFHRSSAMIDGK